MKLVSAGLAAIACGMVMIFASPLPGSALITTALLNWQLLAGILTILAGGALLQFHADKQRASKTKGTPADDA